MLRRFFAAVVVLVVCIGVMIGAELKGKITEVDTTKRVITVAIEGRNNEAKVRVGKEVKIVGADGKEIDLKDLKKDQQITATFEVVEKDGKKVRTYKEIKVNR